MCSKYCKQFTLNGRRYSQPTKYCKMQTANHNGCFQKFCPKGIGGKSQFQGPMNKKSEKVRALLLSNWCLDFSDFLPLLTAEDIWFKCNLYLQFIPPITLWKICIDLRPFSKCFRVPFSRTLRSLRSNNLEIQNDENSK